LETRDFMLIAFCAHDPQDTGHIDPVRTQTILGRGSPTATRAWFEGFGIATSRRPVRTPADPATEIRARICIPVRSRQALLRYLWVLDDGAISGDDPRLGEASEIAQRIADALSARMATSSLADVLPAAFTGTRSEQTAAARELARFLGTRPAAI